MPEIRASDLAIYAEEGNGVMDSEYYQDKVNPAHYQTGSGLEAIHVIEAFDLDFCKGNCVKYLLRAGKKEGEDEISDLRKAQWYISRRIAQLEGKTEVDR
jgi:hypothetical protein